LNIRWTQGASRNLDQIEAYIYRDNPIAARKVICVIINTVQKLVEHPEIGRPGRVLGSRELVIPRLPYIVPYRIHYDSIEVLRVMHTAREWPDAF